MPVAVPKIGMDDEALKKAKMAALQPKAPPSLMTPKPLPQQRAKPIPAPPKSTPPAMAKPSLEKPIDSAPTPILAPSLPKPAAPPAQAPAAPQRPPGAPPEGTMTTQGGPGGGGIDLTRVDLGNLDLGGFKEELDRGESPKPVVVPDEPMRQETEDPLTDEEMEAGRRQTDIDKAIADLLLGTINDAGKADTSKDEALIKEQLGDEIGTALVNQRASMGRAGFGSSGALGAMEGDIQRQARQAALGETLDLRRTEDQRSRDNAFRGIGAEIGMRQQAEEEFFNKALLDAIRSSQGLEPLPDEGGGLDFPGTATGNPLAGITDTDAETPDGTNGISAQDPITTNQPPPGGQLVSSSASFGDVYKGSDGKYYRVPPRRSNSNDQRESGRGYRQGGG